MCERRPGPPSTSPTSLRGWIHLCARLLSPGPVLRTASSPGSCHQGHPKEAGTTQPSAQEASHTELQKLHRWLSQGVSLTAAAAEE